MRKNTPVPYCSLKCQVVINPPHLQHFSNRMFSAGRPSFSSLSQYFWEHLLSLKRLTVHVALLSSLQLYLLIKVLRVIIIFKFISALMNLIIMQAMMVIIIIEIIFMSIVTIILSADMVDNNGWNHIRDSDIERSGTDVRQAD